MNTEQAPKPPDLARELLEHRDVLFSYTMALVRDWNTAEEVFQETSLVILKKAQEGVTVRDFGAWSREIARRTALNFWKTSRNERHGSLTEATVDAIDAAFAGREQEHPAATTGLLARLAECLEKLPGNLRQLVDLRYRDGLSFQAIGDHTGKSAGAAQVALSRTRVALHDCLKQAGAQDRELV
ncbi:MAG: sigma-70 family RNA polymerase sigma factor [Planctomycetota bacterium]